MRTLSSSSRRLLVVGGVVLLALALGLGTYVATRSDKSAVAAVAPTPLIADASTGGAGPNGRNASIDRDFSRISALSEIPNARTVESGRNRSPLEVDGGDLLHGAPTGADAASYLEIPVTTVVTRIGVSARFARDGGSVALVAWQDSLAAARSAKRDFPFAGVHFVADEAKWNLGVFDPEIGATILMQGNYTPTGPSGSPQSFEVLRDGSSVVVVLPDGTRSTTSDPRISAWTGRWATWELYEPTPSDAPATISAIWAD